MINLIILREHRFPAVPSTITERVFGPEMIVDDKGHVLARGESVLLQGSDADLKTFLHPLGKVWSSDNPMMGKWQEMEIKSPDEVLKS